MVNVVMAVDPGGDSGTGYCVYEVEAQKPLYLHEQADSLRECVARTNGAIQHFKPDAVVLERFVPRWGKPFSLDPVYKLGALEILAPNAVLVMPNQHMDAVQNSVVNPMLKKAGEKIGKGHKREALRMCLWYAAFRLNDRATLDMLAGQGIKEEK